MKQDPRIKKYKDGTILYNFYYIKNVPPSLAKKLLTGHPNVDPLDRQNNSPTMIDMITICEKYDGTLSGYVRLGDKITFDEFTIKTNELNALRLYKMTGPSEFQKVGKNMWRFWWD